MPWSLQGVTKTFFPRALTYSVQFSDVRLAYSITQSGVRQLFTKIIDLLM